MGIGGVVVRLTHSSPSAHESDGVNGWRCGAPRLGAVRIIELHVLAAVAAAGRALRYGALPRTSGDDCRKEQRFCAA